ncbi:MAG: hypothetical protein AB7S38_20385 [Vulcanimicrobiota bacterium]
MYLVTDEAPEGLPTTLVLECLLEFGSVPDHQQLDALQDACDRMFASYDAEEELAPALEEKVQGVNDALGAFQAALEQEEGLEAARDDLIEAVEALHWGRLASGRSPFGVINVYRNLWALREHPELPGDAWTQATERSLGFYGAALDELEASGKLDDPTVAHRHQALCALIGVLEGVGQQMQDPEEFVEPLRTALLEVNLAVKAYGEGMVDGPTGSRPINHVHLAAVRVRRGLMEPELLERAIEPVRTIVLEWLSQVDHSEGPHLRPGLEHLGQALTELARFAREGQDGPAVEAALAGLVAHGNAFTEAYAIYKKHLEQAHTVVCVACGARHRPGERACSCGAVLPRWKRGEESAVRILAGESGIEAGAVVTAPMRELADACQAFERQELPLDAFRALLEKHAEQASGAELRLGQLRLPELPAEATAAERAATRPVEEFGRQSLDALLSGLNRCLDGLQEMMKAAENGDPVGLRQGLQRYGDGSQLVWEARQAYELATAEA